VNKLKNFIKTIFKYLVLGTVGGTAYTFIELLYRGYSHWTMYFVSAVSFILIGLINEYISWDMKLCKQMTIGACIVTLMEFISGYIINIKLGWQVWDYSNLPFNIMGQICLPFSIIWFFVSFIAIVTDDYLRYWLFNEEKPYYKF
jgi:Predicted membrane protein